MQYNKPSRPKISLNCGRQYFTTVIKYTEYCYKQGPIEYSSYDINIINQCGKSSHWNWGQGCDLRRGVAKPYNLHTKLNSFARFHLERAVRLQASTNSFENKDREQCDPTGCFILPGVQNICEEILKQRCIWNVSLDLLWCKCMENTWRWTYLPWKK